MTTERSRESDVEIALMRKDLDEMKLALDKLEKQVGGLLEAWNTATGLVKFVKWLAVLVGAGGVIWAAFSGYFHK